MSISYSSDPATSFNIQVIFQNPIAGMNIGIFFIVIKKQVTDLFIDLI
jgi:hypothetical protein